MEISRYASAGHFKVNYETDSRNRYNGRTRILCKCSLAGQSTGQRKKKRAVNEDDENDESLTSLFPKTRGRPSLRTGCPWRIVAWSETKPLCGETLVSISLINNVHNCKPCEERLEVIRKSRQTLKTYHHHEHWSHCIHLLDMAVIQSDFACSLLMRVYT
jgi:hypothetical protein